MLSDRIEFGSSNINQYASYILSRSFLEVSMDLSLIQFWEINMLSSWISFCLLDPNRLTNFLAWIFFTKHGICFLDSGGSGSSHGVLKLNWSVCNRPHGKSNWIWSKWSWHSTLNRSNLNWNKSNNQWIRLVLTAKKPCREV